PHASIGPACGAIGVTRELEPFLPVPVIRSDGTKYWLDRDRPDSIGKGRGFLGNLQGVVRAYARIMSLGADGLRAVAETAVLNNNYLATKIAQIPGASISYPEGGRRLEQVRYSWEGLCEETGVGTEDVRRRVVDFGFQAPFTSHHPVLVPEPFTLEPSESLSKADLDEHVAALRQIADEARRDPDTVRR